MLIYRMNLAQNSPPGERARDLREPPRSLTPACRQAGLRVVLDTPSSSRRRSRPTKYHRFIATGTHSSLQRGPTNPFIFRAIQKSAQLIENKHSQIHCSQSIAHSLSLFSCKSRICRSYAKHTRGCIPPSTTNLSRDLKLFRQLPENSKHRAVTARTVQFPFEFNVQPPAQPDVDIGEQQPYGLAPDFRL